VSSAVSSDTGGMAKEFILRDGKDEMPAIFYETVCDYTLCISVLVSVIFVNAKFLFSTSYATTNEGDFPGSTIKPHIFK